MKNLIKSKWYLYVIFYSITILFYFFAQYGGVPYDVFKNGNEYDIMSSENVQINGYGINGFQYTSLVDDPNITFYDQHIRTIILDIQEMHISDNNICKVYFSDSKEDFSEQFSKEYSLKVGRNYLVVPYIHSNNNVRVDIGNDEGDTILISSFLLCDKFIISPFEAKKILLLLLIIIIITTVYILYQRKERLVELSNAIDSKVFSPFYSTFELVKAFGARHKLSIGILGLITAIAYSALINNYTLSIDEENNMTNANEYLVYISSGRFMLALLIKFFGNSPYFNSFSAGIFMFIATILLLIIFEKYQKSTKLSLIISGGLFISMPYVIGETLNFSMQGIYISFAYCSLLFSILMLISFIDAREKNGRLSFFVFFIVSSVTAFGIYQSFVVVFVFVISCIFFIRVRQIRSADSLKELHLFIIQSVILLSCALILYVFINLICGKLISPPLDYLTNNFVGWNKHMENTWVLRNVWSNWSKLIKGEYYNMTGGNIVKITMIFYSFWSLITLSSVNRYNRLWIYILVPATIIIPFFIPLCLGSFIMLGRSLNAFPVLIAFIWFVILNDLRELKISYKFVGCLAIITLIFQLKYYNEFVYTDQLRYQLDINLAHDIMCEIEKIENYENKPVCFNGVYNFKNQNTLAQVSGCESFWAFGTGDTLRILNFLNLSGYTVQYPSEEQKQTARQQSLNLPTWPNEGSVYDAGDYVIVNFENIE